MRRWLCGTTALAAVLGFGSATAEAAPVGDEIVVVATRTAADPFEVPATTTVITEEEIEAQLATDIKDLIRFEPGVSVRASPSRFSAAFASTGRDGNSGFNIRGLEGNRVLFLVDGVRVPDGFSFGPAAFGRGDYVDLDLLRAVEIVRGPASALYGSDGLAGVVSFITKDPDDMLEGDASFAGRARVAYAEADESFAEGLSAAWRAGAWQAMAAYTRRDGRELANRGEVNTFDATCTAPNPQDIASDAAMARLVYAPSDAHRFRATFEYGEREIVTEAYAARSVLPPAPGVPASTAVIDIDGLDESERSRIGVDYFMRATAG